MVFNVLYGAGDSGKTSTLRILAHKLSLIAQVTDPSDLLKLEGKGDFIISFYLKNKMILIASAGDTRKELEPCIELACKSDFVFCASRTKGQTRDFLHSYIQGSESRWIRQLTISGDREQSLANDSTAEFLYRLLLLDIK